jgi:acyl-CoA thioesterase I
VARVIRKTILAFVFGFFGYAATAEPVTIAALGDSLTQGYGLAQQDGFVPRLESWLRAQGADVVVINAGVSGDTTAGGAARIDWTLTPEVNGVIVALGGNDLLRGIAPEVARTNLEAILTATDKANVAVLLIGVPAPGNYGPDYKMAFDAIYPELAAKHGALYAPNFLKGVTGANGRAKPGMMQADGLHPNPDGVALIVAALGPVVLDLVARIEAGE